MIAKDQAVQGAALKVRNLVELFHERARTSGAQRAAMYRQNGTWRSATWSQLATRVRNAANGLVSLGVQPGDRVCCFAATWLDWAVADLAIMAAGAITVPIYASNTAEEAQYIVENSGAKVLFVDNDVADGRQPGRLSRVKKIQAAVPALAKVIAFDPAAAEAAGALSLAKLEQDGEQHGKAHPAAYDQRVAAVMPDQAACFIYTSGTTGNPKGVVLTHQGWVYEAQGVGEAGLLQSDELVLLFLPLAHSFAKVIEAAWLGLGFTMAFCESSEKILEYAAEVRPTVLPAVPRIFEKVYNGVVQKALAQPGVKGKLAAWALGEFDHYAAARQEGRPYSSLGFTLAKALVFKKISHQVKERVGGHMRLFISGGAPLARKIAYFFDVSDIVILEGYGLTESSAATTVNRPTQNKIGTVGAPLPGTEIKIAGDGEILIRGPGVMKAYYQNPEATKEALEPDGWLHSGDIGEVDADGYVRITDRKKDIIVTAGGKNVAPQNLENALKAFPIISQVMVHGDKRKFLSALVTVNEEAAKKLLEVKGVPFADYADMSRRPEVREAVQRAIDQLNATLPPYETIKKLAILEKDFSQETGELTPTLKVKRKVCTQKYLSVLNGFYDEAYD